MPQTSKIQRLWQFITREHLHRLFIVLVVLVFIGSIGIALLEPQMSWKNALWFSFVTITTVGYGDFSPVTAGGRVVGIVLMILGIGILGLFTANIASVFVTRKLKEDRGMHSFEFENHFIICEWNHRARAIVQEWRLDPRLETTPIVLIAELETKPLDDDDLYFIHGSVSEENLNRANLGRARTVVILGDDQLEPNARDAKAVLTTLTVETINRDVYSIVELVNEANVQHCERANANEIIVGSEFSSKLISRAARYHGISKVLSELLSSRFGNDLYKIPVPQAMQGKQFIDVFTEMKRARFCTVLAIQKGPEGRVVSNPAVDTGVEAGDYLIVIADRLPKDNP